MAQNNFDACLKIILHYEGGFSNDPRDPGGMTNLGVTKKAWEDYVGHPVDEAEMRSLTVEKVSPFYKTRYWDVNECDLLPAGLDLCVFDFGINTGVAHSAKFLQHTLKVTEDGHIGPATIQAVSVYSSQPNGLKNLIINFQLVRSDYYKACHNFPTFGRGWLRRTGEITLIATGTMVK